MVTQEGVLSDDFLRCGEWLTLQSRGMTLVQASGRAALAIEARSLRAHGAIVAMRGPEAGS